MYKNILYCYVLSSFLGQIGFGKSGKLGSTRSKLNLVATEMLTDDAATEESTDVETTLGIDEVYVTLDVNKEHNLQIEFPATFVLDNTFLLNPTVFYPHSYLEYTFNFGKGKPCIFFDFRNPSDGLDYTFPDSFRASCQPLIPGWASLFGFDSRVTSSIQNGNPVIQVLIQLKNFGAQRTLCGIITSATNVNASDVSFTVEIHPISYNWHVFILAVAVIAGILSFIFVMVCISCYYFPRWYKYGCCRGPTISEEEAREARAAAAKAERFKHGLLHCETLFPKKLQREIDSLHLAMSQTWGNKEGKEPACVVCADSIAEEELVRMLLCRHYFHSDCIDLWFEEHTECPVCRLDYRELDMQEIKRLEPPKEPKPEKPRIPMPSEFADSYCREDKFVG